MDSTGAGTAIMIGVAALLWFLYLVPTWVRRREYLATERTATRLQQTMRVLAETAEVPTPVRVAVDAREAARQERILRAAVRRADAAAQRHAMAVRRAAHVGLPVAAPNDALRRTRIRRTRAVASLVLLAAIATGLVQVWLMVTTGVAPLAWLVLLASLGAGTLSIAVQRRLDARMQPAAPAARRSSATRAVPDIRFEAPAAERRPWTPVPTPQPLYLARPAATPVVEPAETLAAKLRAASAQSEENLREAHAAPEVAPIRPAASSRFARMGVIDESAVGQVDLDEALRRRRSVG